MCSVVRGLTAALGAVVILLGTPSESKAIFHWFRSDGCGCASQATTYAPPFMPRATTVGYAPAGGCCTPYAACYTPQTCYRPVSVSRPVVTYMPVQACNPCGGCATVAYQPTTTWVRQVRMVPYTSYRVTYSNPCVPCFSSCSSPCASPCGFGGCATGGCATGGCTTGTCGVSSGMSYAAPSGCSSCATSTTVVTPQPSLAPAPNSSAPAPTPAQTPAPASSSAPGALPTPTFKNTESTPTDSRMKPIPSSTSAPAEPLPTLGAPGNHTAQRPVYHAAYYLISSSNSSPAPAVKPAVIDDVDGWRVVKE